MRLSRKSYSRVGPWAYSLVAHRSWPQRWNALSRTGAKTLLTGVEIWIPHWRLIDYPQAVLIQQDVATLHWRTFVALRMRHSNQDYSGTKSISVAISGTERDAGSWPERIETSFQRHIATNGLARDIKRHL